MKLPFRAPGPLLVMLLLGTAACATAPGEPVPRHPAESATDDPFLWLEEVSGDKPLAWVRERNERAFSRLKTDPRHRRAEREIRKILLAEDRIPMPALRGGRIYNFWQDRKQVRGLWRRTTPDLYPRKNPRWETLLDLDALATAERENWVWKGAECLPPLFRRCILQLSRGGKDASVYREFDVESREFVAGGFSVPEAKSSVSWIDADTLFVGTDFGPGSLTTSGYPRQVRVWSRGTPLADARKIFEAETTDVIATGHSVFTPGGNYSFVTRTPSFFEEQTHLRAADGRLTRLPVPDAASFSGVFEGRAFFLLRSDWRAHGSTYPSGVVVALDLSALEAAPEIVFAPSASMAFQSLHQTSDAIYVTYLDNVRGRIARLRRVAGGPRRWLAEAQAFPDTGSVGAVAVDAFSPSWIAEYSSFAVPTTLSWLDGPGAEPKPLRSLPPRFNARGVKVEQRFALSRDGTRVPYFVIRPSRARAGSPTLLYGYGGFEAAMTPSYLTVLGKLWLEKGGIYVLANISGGGEYGPRWHQAALKEHRQRAFDDFIAVAEDLEKTGITSRLRLAIQGGSNGGLLVGAVAMQRPELFSAVVCQVPLLDMLRYHRLLAGASWLAEYGDPDDSSTPAIREAILKYSPFQNARAGAAYPEIFLVTSTLDDRVHPGHARKMVARLESQGHPVLYFENIEGGHGAAANLEQEIHRRALETTYLYQKLMD